MKKICSAVLLAAFALTVSAQSTSDSNQSYSGTNSPYSQYGFGELSDQTSGFNRGMNGLGLAFREHNQVNQLNPASYSAIDSLTFLFDVGVSGQLTNFKEGSKKVNARNADFDYVVAGFRAFRHVGVRLGLIPYSNVGYKYSSVGYLGANKTESYTNTYRGNGGFHQVYLGIGWEFVKHLSVGANVSYMWGDYERAISNEYNDASINTLRKYYSASVSNFKLDFGAQYTLPFSKKDALTVGVTFSPNHKLGADPECKVISVNSSTSRNDTTSYKISNGLELPMSLGIGLQYNHNNQLKLGVDYQQQQWSKVGFPVYSVTNDVASYTVNKDYFKDRHKLTVGGEYCQNEYGRSFMSRMRYRFGASYTTPYLKINGHDGPKEISVSAGFGIPIVNAINNRSFLNISAQWVNQKAKDLIDTNTFRINIGITFNERWFAKWKVE